MDRHNILPAAAIIEVGVRMWTLCRYIGDVICVFANTLFPFPLSNQTVAITKLDIKCNNKSALDSKLSNARDFRISISYKLVNVYQSQFVLL